MQPPSRRLLHDPYSRHFVRNPFLRACLAHPRAARGFLALLNYVFGAAAQIFTVLRVRYTDDVYQQALTEGIDQVVLLGAGFDTTTLRRPAPGSVTTYEVDAPPTQADKRAVVQRLRVPRSDQLVWVPCDFEHDALREKLVSRGFDPSRPSLITWIGVTGYLTGHAIESTLTDLAQVCAPDSVLVFDYLDADAAPDGDRSSPVRRWARARGSAARFGEPLRTTFTAADADALLARHGFQCREHLRVSDLLHRYAPTYPRRHSLDAGLAITTARRI
jgi:methyltransferase (TIGR00027 family)